MVATKPVIDRGYIRALKYDYLGEISTEVNFLAQSYVTWQPEVKEKAREFAKLEAETRELIAEELARYGIKMGRHLWLRWLTFVMVIPIKLLLPTRLWVYLIYGSTLRAMSLYESQERRWRHLNPIFFDRLIAHEVKQRDWARDYLNRGRAGVKDQSGNL